MQIAGSGKCLGWQYPSVATFCGPNIHSIDFVSVQLLRNQYSPTKLVFWLYMCPTSILFSNFCPPFHTPPPTNYSIPDTTLLVHLAIFYSLFGRWELLKAATSTGEVLKHYEIVHNLFKFHSCAHNPWLVKVV